MDHWPLVMDEIEAGANLIRDLKHYAPIKVAFWLRADDESYRHLYISSDHFDRAKRPQAYGEVARIIQERPSLFLEPSQVTLISGEDRFAGTALQIHEKSPGRLGNRLRSERFGDRYIADAYIYPSPIPDESPRFQNKVDLI